MPRTRVASALAAVLSTVPVALPLPAAAAPGDLGGVVVEVLRPAPVALTVPETSLALRAGDDVELRTRLATPDGRGVAGARVVVLGRRGAADPWRALRTLTTDRQGLARTALGPERSAEYSVRHDPTVRHAAAVSPVVRVTVARTVQRVLGLRVVPVLAEPGADPATCCPLAVDGAPRPARGLPLHLLGTAQGVADGTPVTVEAMARWGEWQTVATPRVVDGRFDVPAVEGPCCGYSTVLRAVVAAAGAAPALRSPDTWVTPAAPRLSATLPPAVARGQVLRVEGTWAPASAGRVVRLQQLRDRVWTTAAEAVTTADGRFSLVARPPQPGTHGYRVAAVAQGRLPVQATPPSTVVVRDAPLPAAWATALSDLSPATAGPRPLPGAVRVDGREHARSLRLPAAASLDLPLGADAATFHATVAVAAPGPAGAPAELRVRVDGRTVLSRTVPDGTAFPLAVDVRGARTLSVAAGPTGHGGDGAGPLVVLGSAAVTSAVEPPRGVVPGILYLADRAPVAVTGGVRVADDLLLAAGTGPAGSAGWTLDGGRTRLTASARLGGGGAGTGSVRVVGDGRLLATYEGVGAVAVPLDVDVRGVRDLRVELALGEGAAGELRVSHAAVLP
ncbi:NPCBM/NEW2 domain-containing protein [Vallicoccus soli]|uniref:Glycosyl hydrolase family 98 putative carbohydrate-binding module domain-containing protein n=1 Tax=Vallicoccus soli TaxID=2339232 RepID=A0A3A3YW57_9ACTN|nr:NPCBM/NEW2 domain-containing protein [Vallicoccus soli]RJK94917.1 hypothetical protein D5H78_14100 [Vallicoccus soli]